MCDAWVETKSKQNGAVLLSLRSGTRSFPVTMHSSCTAATSHFQLADDPVRRSIAGLFIWGIGSLTGVRPSLRRINDVGYVEATAQTDCRFI